MRDCRSPRYWRVPARVGRRRVQRADRWRVSTYDHDARVTVIRARGDVRSTALFVFLAAPPFALALAFAVSSTEATEFLFYPALILIPFAVGFLTGPTAWSSATRGETAVDALSAAGAMALTLLAVGVAFSTVDEVHDRWVAVGATVGVAVYGLAVMRLGRSRTRRGLRSGWALACAVSVLAGTGAVAAAAGVEALFG